jgi:L-lactate dehydrogenase complex protein LldG
MTVPMKGAKTGARDDILGTIRRRLGRADWSEERLAARRAQITARISNPPPNPIPSRARGGENSRLRLFRDMVELSKATLTRVDENGAAEEVANYVARENLTGAMRGSMCIAAEPGLDALANRLADRFMIRRGKPDASDAISVTGAFAAVAETGTLVLVSSPEHPSTLNLLAETHIAILREDRIVGSYEEAFAMLRAARDGRRFPRTVMFVTGPSRSADIEQTIQYGAHGPRRVHILLLPPASGAIP